MPAEKKVDPSTVKVEKAVPVEVPVPKSHHQTVTALAHTFWERRGRPRNDDWTDWLAAEAQAQENGSG